MAVRAVDRTRMVFPGRTLLVYRSRGVHRFCWPVFASDAETDPCAATDFVTTLEPTVDMLSDHQAISYHFALQEIAAQHAQPKAARPPPEWEPIDKRDSCACCGSAFTWACTTSSEAQTHFDTHNCHLCGCTVCEGCSQHRIALPELGVPRRQVRVCDACFYKLPGLQIEGGGGSCAE